MHRSLIAILCLLIAASTAPTASAAGMTQCGGYDVRFHEPDDTASNGPVDADTDRSEVIVLVESADAGLGATITANRDCAVDAAVSTTQCIADEVVGSVNLDLGKVPEPVRTFVHLYTPLLGEHGRAIDEIFEPKEDDPPLIQQIKGCL